MTLDRSFAIAPGDEYPITLGFGEVVPSTAQYGPHTGLDIGAPLGSPVDALVAGTVTSVRTEQLGGLEVEVTSDTGYRTLFAHLSDVAVAQGDRVAPDTLLAYSGASGSAVTGPHLHIETHDPTGALVDPLSVLGGTGASSPGCDPDAMRRAAITLGAIVKSGKTGAAAAAALRDAYPQLSAECLQQVAYGSASAIASGPDQQAARAITGAVSGLPAAIGGLAGGIVTTVAVLGVVALLVVAGGRRIVG